MIYILKFSEKLGSHKHSAQYYVGYCEDGRLMDRLEDHRNGRGACITRAAVAKGLKLSLVTAFPGNRHLERQIKRMKNTPRLVKQIEKHGWRAAPTGANES